MTTTTQTQDTQANKRGLGEGVESNNTAPTPYLNQIAETLRQPPAKPGKNANTIKKLLGLKLKRNQFTDAPYTIINWLKTNIDETVIDHYTPLVLETGDVFLFTQPYHHPNKTELTKIEKLGGYVVHPDQAWAFLHPFCLPDVYLVPAESVKNFNIA